MPEITDFSAPPSTCSVQSGLFRSFYVCRSIHGRSTDGAIEVDLFPPADGEPFWVGLQYQVDGFGRWRVTRDLRFVTDDFGDLVQVAR